MISRDYSNLPHRAGDIYQLNDEDSYYLLSIVEGWSPDDAEPWVKLALISLADGNRWSDPIRIRAPNPGRPGDALTEEEFATISDTDGSDAFHKVSGRASFVALH